MAFLDFFKPHWKHSNPAVRAASIRILEDDQEPVLLTIALEDTDASNRLAAAKRIKDPDLVKKLRDKTTDKNIKEIAQKQWIESQIEVAKSDAKDATGQSLVTSALDAVAEDQRALEDIARNAASLEIRNLAFGKLVHASAFQAIALNEEEDTLALKALNKIVREGHLDTLSKSAKSKAVRIAAKERLKTVSVPKGPDLATINRAKLALILSVSEKINAVLEGPAVGIHWEALKTQMDETGVALSELMQAGIQPEPQKLARFQEVTAKLHAQYARWKHEHQVKEEKAKQAAANQILKEEICERLEELLQSGATLGNISPAASANTDSNSTEGPAEETSSASKTEVVEIRALRERFQATGPAPEGLESEYQKRFRFVWDKLERASRDKETQARRLAEEKEHGGRLQDLCAQAESLAQLSPTQSLEKFRDLRKEWNKAINAAGAFAGKEELRKRYESAVASTETAFEALRKINLDRMRDLVPALEALLEAPDMMIAEKNFKVLNGEWKALSSVPAGPEADEYFARYQAFIERFREAQDWLRWSNHRSKVTICDKLDALLLREDAKAMVGPIKELQGEWKSIGPVPWDSSEALWDRYNHACDALYEKCREYFAELEVERESNLKAKEDICARLEALLAAEDVDWREAMEVVKEAQGSWKTLGAVPKAQSDVIWTRFRTACNTFFERKDKHNTDNLSRKLELVVLVESLQDSTEWKNTGTQIKQAQENWKTIGPVPRDQAEAIWQRFHAACEKFFQARKVFLEKLDLEKPENLAKKEALCLAMEGLDSLPNDLERFERIKEAQAAWKEIGPVPKEMEETIWERFRKPVDHYFEARKAKMGEERATREENAKVKEDICIEAESLIGSIEWKATIDKIKSLQERWKATGPAPRELDKDLWNRFRTACDGFFDRLKENSAKRDGERGQNLIRKTDLCFLAEAMTKRTLTEEQAKAKAEFDAKSLPVDIARFRVEGIDWNDNTEKIKAIQREWKKIGPVPREESDAIWDRFHSACDAFFEERRVALGLPAEDPQVSLDKKLALISEAEALAQNPTEDAGKRVQSLQREWKRIGPVPPAQSDYVWKRFTEACDAAFKTGGRGEGSIGASAQDSVAAR